MMDYKNRIKIISDGTPQGTSVFDYDGKNITDGVTNIKLEIGVDTLMTAVITYTNVECSIYADWINHPLKQWANRKVGRI